MVSLLCSKGRKNEIDAKVGRKVGAELKKKKRVSELSWRVERRKI